MSRSSSSEDAMKVDFENMRIEKKLSLAGCLEDCLKSRMLNRKAKSCPTVAVVQKRRKWRLDRVWSNGKKK